MKIKATNLKPISIHHKDILQWDFVDSFRNLTVKECLFLQFSKQNVTLATHIFKGDDDIFLNPIALTNLIKSQSNRKNMFIGSVLAGSPRILDWWSKYYVPMKLFPHKEYPPYVSGGGYIMSKEISDKLFEATLRHRIFPIDDAFVGVLLKDIGKVPTNNPKFRSWGAHKGEEISPCYWHEKVITFHRKLPNELISTWKDFTSVVGKCKQRRRRR